MKYFMFKKNDYNPTYLSLTYPQKHVYNLIGSFSSLTSYITFKWHTILAVYSFVSNLNEYFKCFQTNQLIPLVLTISGHCIVAYQCMT